MNNFSEMPEMELRKAALPQIDSIEKLCEFIELLMRRHHTYGTAPAVATLAAAATFKYVACGLGLTGFQASCADLDFIRRTRNLDGPFWLCDGARLLYPQYNLYRDLEKFINDDDTQAWLRDTARQRLLNARSGKIAPADAVAKHWEKLVKNEQSI